VSNRFVETIGLVVDTAARDGFRVALIGGFATPFHGVMRATGDVDFLVEATGADTLDAALAARGFAARHRTENVANYASGSPGFAPVDPEGIIGLKVQAIANDPRRRRQDEADIVSLLRLHATTLDLAVVRSYFAAFGMEGGLDRLLEEVRGASPRRLRRGGDRGDPRPARRAPRATGRERRRVRPVPRGDRGAVRTDRAAAAAPRTPPQRPARACAGRGSRWADRLRVTS